MTRRRVLTNLAGLAVVAIVAFVGYLVLVAPPLAFANASAIIGGSIHGDQEDVPQYDVPYADQGDVRWGVEVRNTLPLPITINGLASVPLTTIGLITDPQLHLLRDARAVGVEPDAVQPFEPMTLGSGDTVFLAVSDRFVDCGTAHARWMAGSGVVRSDLDLAISVLGLARTAKVALPFTLEYFAPASCPEQSADGNGAPACAPPADGTGAPPAKPMPTSLGARPLGPFGDGFVVALTSAGRDGNLTAWCIVDATSHWTGIDMPADADLDTIGAVTDGHAIAAPILGEESTPDDNAIGLGTPGSAPKVVALRDAADSAWLDDWAFWGSIEAIPDGGFLLAGGTRLAVLGDDGRLTFHDMPDGLTPLSPTSEPGTWLVAGAGARQPGGAIAPPFMIWSEGQPQPTEIAGSWEAWTAARHSTGLIWLRGPTAWALLHADGSITQLPEDNAPTYETDISPDGSVLLVRSSGCGLGDVATCRVHAIDAVSGAEISTLPGEGLTAWGDDGGLFVMLGGPGSPALFLIRDSGVTTLTFPAWTQ